MSAPDLRPPEDCAICGEPIPPRARSCPSCGADERTGWREQSLYDGLDLPSSDEEFSTTPPVRRHGGLPWYWLVTFAAVVLVLLLTILGRL